MRLSSAAVLSRVSFDRYPYNLQPVSRHFIAAADFTFQPALLPRASQPPPAASEPKAASKAEPKSDAPATPAAPPSPPARVPIVAAASVVDAPASEQPPVVIPEGIDLATSGLRHLGDAGKRNALNPKVNPFEKKKNEKCGSSMWTEGERGCNCGRGGGGT